MRSRDLVTLNLSTQGGQAVVADLAKIRSAIGDIRFENEGLRDSYNKVRGEIAATRKEVSQHGNEIKKNERIVASLTEKNKDLQAKMRDLTTAGKEESAQFQRLSEKVNEHNTRIQEARANITQYTNAQRQARNTLQQQVATRNQYSSSMTNNSARINELRANEERLISTMRVEQMSVTQLRQRYNQLKRERDAISKALYPEQWNKLNTQLMAVEKQLARVTEGGKKANTSFNRMKETVTKVITLMTVYAAMRVFQNILREISDFIKQAPEVAAKAQGITNAFKKLNDTKMMATLRKETKGLVNDIELMKASVRTDYFGIPINNLGKYLKFAQQRAQATGESVDYLVNSIVNGIGRKSPLILDNLGISAARLKKEMSSGADIIQATTKIVEEELEKQGDVALTTAEKATQASVKWENAQLKLGKRMTWMSEIWSGISGKIADGIANLAGETRSATEIFDDQIESVADLEVNAHSLANRYDELKSKTTLSNTEQAEMTRIMNTLAQAVPGIVTEFDKYGNILSINTQRVYDYIDAEKARLKFVHADAIADLEKKIKFERTLYKSLEKEVLSGQTTYRVPTSDRTSTTQYREMSDKEKAEKQAQLKELGGQIRGAELELARISGTALEEQVNYQKEIITKRGEFNQLTKAQLDAWIKNEVNAASKFMELAKQVYNARFGADTEIDDETENKLLARQKKELDTQLTNLENAHKKELQLLQDTKLKEKQTDEEYKIAVAKSDKKYYDERVKTLENYKKKVSDKKFIADIDKQVVDSTGKSKEQDPIIDQANVSKLGKNRDESLRFEQVGTNELKRTLATREENEKVYALRMQTLELTSSQNRLEILRQYSKEVQELDIADARLKEELVREANDAVIVAETDAIVKRKALDKSYFDSNKETREKYGKVTISEEKANELAILQAYYNAGLISLKTFEESKIAITRKYEEEKLQVREQYNIASVQELYDQELEQLRLKLEQELLTEEEFEQAKWQLKLNYATEFAQKINQLTGMAVNMGNALQEAATAKLEAEYQVRIAAAQGNAAEQERLEQELAEKKLEIEKEYADVQFAIKASEIISSTAVAIMVAYKQLGPIMGSVAAAMLGVTGAAQLVSANAERQKVKSLTLGSSGKTSAGSGRVVVGLETGGYMDVTRQQDGKNFRAAYNPNKRGYVNRPTVIVGEGRAGESLEYVIPNKAMKNPTLRPIIDLIDYESRKGTIGTVDMNQMIRGRLAGFESGGAIDSSASTSSANNVPTVVNGYRQPSEVELETLALLRHLNKNGVFTNLSLGSVKSGLDTMDKQDNKFRFGDQ